MNRIILLLSMFFALGCSSPSNSEEPPIYIKNESLLYPFFSNTETKGQAQVLTTIKKGNLYNLSLYPCCQSDEGLVKSVRYYLDDVEICNTNQWTVHYTVKVAAGKYILSCKPQFTNDYLIWKPTTMEITVEE